MTILTSLRSLRGLSLVLTAAVFMLFAGSAAPHVAASCVVPKSSLPGACEEPAPAPAPAKNDDICYTTNATVAEKDGKLSVYYLTTSTDNTPTLIMEINLSSLTLTTYANGIAAWVGPSSITGLTSWWVMISKDTNDAKSSYVVTVGQNMSINDKGEATGGIETVTDCNLAPTPTITPYSAPAPAPVTEKCSTEKTAVATAKANANAAKATANAAATANAIYLPSLSRRKAAADANKAATTAANNAAKAAYYAANGIKAPTADANTAAYSANAANAAATKANANTNTATEAAAYTAAAAAYTAAAAVYTAMDAQNVCLKSNN